MIENRQLEVAKQQVEDRIAPLLTIKPALRIVNRFNRMLKPDMPVKAYIFIVYDDYHKPPKVLDLETVETQIEEMKNMLKIVEE